MTEAQSNRTRLEVWKAILVSQGGTPSRNDTLYRTVRKVAYALGLSYSARPSFFTMARDILAANPTIFATNGKMNGHLLPPAHGMRWGTDPTV